ncbi:hypothetical protein B0J11DRAFT_441007 [Dendryphion nanum]|uniref:NACHT domain-containing protein n=1 Tax=Dendryphion nanum TaxID=256645 RepID=A0A9P9IES0_9PLEO|nr:hypothetical protein B0J11DRAFT_441007 [Dendryphion nanum]
MEPLSALSVASNILQIVDFATKIVSRARNIHASADGVLDENSFLESATTNLSELAVELSKDLSRNLYRKSSTGSTDKQLIKLAHEAASVASSLRAKLDNISRRTDGASRNALDQAFRSVWKQNEISTLCNRLDAIRKQVDTALLVSLMNRTNQSLDFEQTKPSQFDDDEMTRKAEILASLQQSHWTEKDQSMEISKFLLSTVNMDVEERFSNMIMARLYFPDLPDRFETIPRAHQDTFQWLLDDTVDGAEACEWSSFTKWLSNTDRQNLYWITGKPGSGKSTLMKYMFNHNKTTAKLQQWNASRPLVKAGFFFWNSGTAMQMSRMGLLQSILHTVLTKDKGTEAVPHTLIAHDRKIITGDKETIMHIFPHRWQQFVAFGGGRQAFTWSELKQAFETLIATPITPRSFFFAIDGLDEFDGEHGKLIEMILNATKFEHVKICIASRPWLVFRDAFENEPNLLLEQLTRQDIHNYVDSAFTNNTHYARLKKIEPGRASSLINDLASKSEGVFLWCYLVVQNLLEGMSNADRMSDLIRRLDTMPPGLEQLFDRLLRELEPQYFKHACQLLRLVMAKDRIYLIDLWFADDENPDSAMTGQVGFLTLDELRYRQEIMNRRLLSRCKCFLNSPYTGSPDVSRCEQPPSILNCQLI